MPSTRRKRAVVLFSRHLIIALGVGLLVNVGFAWHSAWHFGMPVFSWDEFAGRWPRADWPGLRSGYVAGPVQGVIDPGRFLATEQILVEAKTGDTLSLMTQRHGWPWRALRQSSLYRLPHVPIWEGGQVVVPMSNGGPRVVSPPELTEHHGGLGVGGKRLPYIPVWPGFLANTLVFAVPTLLLLTTPGILIRWRRARRGRCIACAYDLTGLPACPECGPV